MAFLHRVNRRRGVLAAAAGIAAATAAVAATVGGPTATGASAASCTPNGTHANGRPFTAADVVANVLHNLDPKVPSLWGPAIKDVRSVRAISKYEVRFRLGGPSAILPEALVPVEMADLTDVSKLNTVGNGTGPYKVSDFVPDQSLTLVPNSIYYGPKACLQKIVFV